jgi:hypothetical protein
VAEVVFEPISIAYRGLFADQHLVDAQQFGRSLIATSKIANSIFHELTFQRITHDPRKYHVRFCVGPSRENGLLQEIFAVVVTGLPLFTPFVTKIGRIFVEETAKAMIYSALKKPDDMNKALDIIKQQAERHADLADKMHEGHMKTTAWLQGMVTELVREHRRPLRELPDPVGRTVRTMAIGKENPIIIDEATAEVLRSKDGLELGDSGQYNIELVGVFKNNGACRIKIVGQNKIVLGKISDPALDQPNNIYTQALNAGLNLHVIAKPTFKDDKLYKLFITSASLSGPTNLHEQLPVST